ncbi:MAG: hypothetical protein ACR2MM_05025 [Flavobacteriaceae bacterium]
MNFTSQSTHILILLTLCLLISTTSCSVTEVAASEDASTAEGLCEACEKTTWSFAWGLVEPVPIDPDCRTGTMTKVRSRWNLGFALISVASVGIVIPQRVEWDCAPDDRGPGEIPD